MTETLPLNISFIEFAEGVGEDASNLHKSVQDVIRSVDETVTIHASRRELREELVRAFNESSRDNWDGEGARPATFEGYCAAEQFLSALPSSVPKPDVLVDPDGEFDFEWRKGNSLASVSVSAQGDLTYAAVYPHSRVRGMEVFDGEIPKLVLEAVQRVFR